MGDVGDVGDVGDAGDVGDVGDAGLMCSGSIAPTWRPASRALRFAPRA